MGYHRAAPDTILALNTRCRSRLWGQNYLNHSFWGDPICTTTRLLFNNHQLSSLSVTDQSCLRQTDLRSRLPSALVLTVDVAGLLIACLSALVEGKLSGKHVLFTLRVGAGGEKGEAGEGRGWWWSQKEEEEEMSDVGFDRMRPDLVPELRGEIRPGT